MEVSGQSHTVVLAHENEPWVPINRIQDGPQNQSGHGEEERETSCPS